MKKNYLKSALIICFLSIVSFTYAQPNEEKINELKTVLKKSLYKSEITINKEGLIERKDNNNNEFSYYVRDIKEIKSDIDGLYTLLIYLKNGKTAKTIVDGKQSDQTLNAFTFQNKADFEKAKSLFEQVIE